MTIQLNYERLVSDYMETLKVELRHFSAPEPLLDMWVPDGDDVTSIVNLVESASMHHVENLAVDIGEKTLMKIDLGKLIEVLQRLGKISTRPLGRGVILDVSLVKRELGQLEPVDIPRFYRKSFGIMANCGCYHYLLEKKETLICCEAIKDKVVLQANVNPIGHSVEEVAYTGAESGVSKYLLDQLCAILVGKPVNECYDHAIIRLEHGLRDKTMKRPPAGGLTLPSNSWEVFKDLTQLIRSAVTQYREIANYKETKNFYILPASQKWLSMTVTAREEALISAVSQFCEERKLDPSCIRIGDLTREVHLIVGVDKNITNNVPKLLMDLEFYLKNKVEQQLNIWTPEESDKNKIRWSDTKKMAVIKVLKED